MLKLYIHLKKIITDKNLCLMKSNLLVSLKVRLLKSSLILILISRFLPKEKEISSFCKSIPPLTLPDKDSCPTDAQWAKLKTIEWMESVLLILINQSVGSKQSSTFSQLIWSDKISFQIKFNTKKDSMHTHIHTFKKNSIQKP